MNVTFDGFYVGFWCGMALAFAFAWWAEWSDRRVEARKAEEQYKQYKRGIDRYLKLQGIDEEEE